MFVKLTNDSRDGKTVTVKAGEAYMQGILLPFGYAEEETVTAERDGGFGSTTKKTDV